MLSWRTMPTRPELIAHRGAPREQVENTLPSIAAALAQGADAIELDVHFTRDHVAIVHHDAVIGAGATRHAGEPINTLHASAVTAIELAPAVTIPSLRDVCATVAGRATLYVELKSAATDDELVGLHDLLVRAASVRPGCVALHAFDHALVRRTGALEPHIRDGNPARGRRWRPRRGATSCAGARPVATLVGDRWCARLRRSWCGRPCDRVDGQRSRGRAASRRMRR